MPGEYIDVYEAAEELGVSRMTLYRLMNERGIRRWKFPGNRRTHIARTDYERLRQPEEREVKSAA
jgi:excisionase family DNA binding protein